LVASVPSTLTSVTLTLPVCEAAGTTASTLKALT
jgi:hypothetical protein